MLAIDFDKVPKIMNSKITGLKLQPLISIRNIKILLKCTLTLIFEVGRLRRYNQRSSQQEEKISIMSLKKKYSTENVFVLFDFHFIYLDIESI